MEKKNDNKISDQEKIKSQHYMVKIQNDGFKLGDQAEYEQSIIKLDKAIDVEKLNKKLAKLSANGVVGTYSTLTL